MSGNSQSSQPSGSSRLKRLGKSSRQGRSLRRRLAFEIFEHRRLLIAEGAVFAINETLDAYGLPGQISATVVWGDGSTGSATVTESDASSQLKFRFDYSLDTNGFFSGVNQSRRKVLELAGQTLLARLTDTLAAITPTKTNQWRPNVHHPSHGNSQNGPLYELSPSLRINANEIVVYAGSRNFPGDILAVGGPGGVSEFSGSNAFMKTVRGRGEPGALEAKPTDFAPSVGSVSFDSDNSTNWYFGIDANGIADDQFDFFSVAVHELAHVLGFGTAPSWFTKVSGNRFTGTHARAADNANGNVPIDDSHWGSGVKSKSGFNPLLSETINAGERRPMTELDFAALNDIGWQVTNGNVTVAATHRFPDNGIYPVEILLRGRNNGNTIAAQTFALEEVLVTNVHPTLTIPGSQTVAVGQRLSLADIGKIVDPGFQNRRITPNTKETFSYSIDWGDGTELDTGVAKMDSHGDGSGAKTTASFNGSHVYTDSGSKTVRVRVEDDDGGVAERSFTVTVTGEPELELQSNREFVFENAGDDAAILTISRGGDPWAIPQAITLKASDTTEIRTAATVVIPAGTSNLRVPVHAVDDALLDGDILATVTASASGVQSGTIDLLVKDRETLTARFSRPSILENRGAGVNLTVKRSNTDTAEPLVVRVGGGQPSQMLHPRTITIPENQQQATVLLVPVDDTIPEPFETLEYTFTAEGYVSDSASIEIVDDEPPMFQNPDDRFDVTATGTVLASDALRIINEIARRNNPVLDPEAEQPDGLFLDVNGDYLVTALDALNVINELVNRNADGERVLNQSLVQGVPDEEKELLIEIDRVPKSVNLF